MAYNPPSGCLVSDSEIHSLVQLTQATIHEIVAEDGVFSLNDFMLSVYNDAIEDKTGDALREAQVTGISYMRMIPRFVSWVIDANKSVELQFKRKGIPTDLRSVFFNAEDARTGIDFVKSFSGLNVNLSKQVNVPKPNISETASFDRAADEVLKSDHFIAAPWDIFITHQDFEVFIKKDKTGAVTEVTPNSKETFYFTVQRAVLDHILNTEKKPGSEIEYPGVGPLFLSLRKTKSLYKPEYGQLRADTSTVDKASDTGVALVLVDENGEPVKFNDKAEVDSKGRIAYWKIPVITEDYFDDKGEIVKKRHSSKGILDNTKIGKSYFTDIIESRLRSLRKEDSSVTYEDAKADITLRVKQLKALREFILKNPDTNPKFDIIGGSFGNAQFLDGDIRFQPLSKLNLHGERFQPIPETKDTTDEFAGFIYTKTNRTGEKLIEIERPAISNEMAEKITTLIFDDLNIDNEGKISDITNEQRLQILKSYIRVRTDNSTSTEVLDIFNDEEGIHVILDGENLDKNEDSKKLLYKYLTSFGIKRQTSKPTARQHKKLIVKGEEGWEEKIKDPANLGGIFMVPKSTPEDKDQYWALDYSKLNVNFNYLKAQSIPGAEQFMDVEIKDNVVSQTGEIMNNWIYNNFKLGHKLDTNGDIVQYNSYFVYQMSDEFISDLFNAEPVLPKGPAPVKPQPVQSQSGEELFRKMRESLENNALNKTEGQKAENIKATEKQIEEAREWYNKSPLRHHIPFEAMFNAINVRNRKSIAEWTLAGIRLFKGSDYSDLYHEAWHGFTQTFMTKEQKDSLYAEVGKLSGGFIDHTGKSVRFSTATPHQLEEFLAEDFRTFMLSGGKSRPGPVRLTWYRKILAFLEALFGDRLYLEVITDISTNNQIYELYDKLRVGNLSEYTFSEENATFRTLAKGAQKFDETDTRDDLNYENSRKLVDTIDSLLSRAVDLMNANVYDPNAFKRVQEIQTRIFLGKTVSQSEIDELKNITQNKLTYSFTSALSSPKGKSTAYAVVKFNLTEIYKNLQEQYDSMPESSDKDRLAKNLELLKWGIDHFGDIDNINNNPKGKGLIGYHISKSKFYGKKDKDEFFEEAEEERKEKGLEYAKSGNELSQLNLADDEIIYLISSLHARTKDNHPEFNEFGVEKLVRFSDIWNKLAVVLAGTMKVDEMYEKIRKESEYFYPFRQLLQKLGPVPTPNDSGLHDKEQALWTKFFQTFNTTQIKLLQLTVSETTPEALLNKQRKDFDYEYSSEEDDDKPEEDSKSTYVIKIGDAYRDFKKVGQRWNSKFKTGRNKPFIKRKNGESYLDIPGLKSRYQLQKVNADPYDFLNDIGIELEDHPEIRRLLKAGEGGAYYIFKNLIEMEKRGIEVKSVNDIFREHPKTNNYDAIPSTSTNFDTLQKLQARYSNEFMTFMVQNAEGETQYEHSLNNTMTMIVNTLNSEKVKDFKGLMQIPYMQYLDPKRNDFAKASIWLNRLFRLRFEKSDLKPGENVSLVGEMIPETDSRYGKRRRVNDLSTGPFVRLNLVNLSGIALERDNIFTNEGTASASADEFSKLIYDFHMGVDKGYFEMMRHSDKTSSFSAHLSHGIAGESLAPGLYVPGFKFLKLGQDGSDGKRLAYEFILPHLSAELERVKRFKKMKEDKVEDFDFGFLDAGQKIQLFDAIFTDELKEKLYKVDEPLVSFLKSTKPGSAELKTEVYKAFDKYFKEQIGQITKLMDESGFIASDMYSKLRTSATQHGIRNLTNDQMKRAMITSFVMNSWIHNLESLVMFYGDVSQYNHTKEEFHKRNAGVGSTGKIFRTDQAMREYLDAKGNLYAKLYGYNYDPYNGIFNSVVLKDSTITSKYLDIIRLAVENNINKRWQLIIDKETNPGKKEALIKKRDELIESGIKPYLENEMKEGDGQGWITFDAYRQLMLAEGEWSDDQDKLYMKIVRGESIDDNVNLSEFFPTKKLQYAGPLVTAGYPIMAQHKFSLFPLIPSVVGDTKHYKDRLTTLGLLHEKMMKEKIHYGLFKSGSKISTITKSAGVEDTLYTDNETREFNKEGEYTKNSVYLEFMKDQLKIAPVFKGKVTFSSQMRKLIEDGLFEFGVPIDFQTDKPIVERRRNWVKSTLAEKLNSSDKFKLIKKYEDAIANLTKLKKEELLEEMNWREVNGKLEGSQDDLVKFIQDQLETQDIAEHELAFLELDPKTEKLRFDPSISPSADKIERVLNAIIVKRLIKQKIKGEGLIQVSIAGFERVNQEEVYQEQIMNIDSIQKVDEPVKIGARFPKDQLKADYATRFIGFGPDNSSTDKYRRNWGDLANQNYDPEDQIMLSVPGAGRVGQAQYIQDIKQEIDKAIKSGVKVFIADNQKTANSSHNKSGEGVIRQHLLDKGLTYHEKDGIGFYLGKTMVKTRRNFRKPTKEELDLYGSNALPFYSPGPTGRTRAMKVKIAMQGDFRNLLQLSEVKELAKEYRISKLKALNILIKRESWLNKGDNRKMVTMMGTRIPTQGLNSMEFMEVHEFLPEAAGNIIVLPTEIVAKSGGDFDIDKLTITMPNISLFGDTPGLVKRMTVTESKEELISDKIRISEKIGLVKQKYQELEDTLKKTAEYERLTEEEKQHYKKLVKESKLKSNELSEQLNSLTKEWKNEMAKGPEYRRHDISKLGDEIVYTESQLAIAIASHEYNRELYFSTFQSAKFTELSDAKKKELAPLLKELGDVKRKIESSSIKAYENDVIDSVVDILSLEENFGRLVFPNGTDIVKTVADDLAEYVSDYSPKSIINANGKVSQVNGKAAISPTRILEIQYNLYKHKSNNIGKATLGLGAVDNTYNTLFNRIGAYLNPTNGVATYDEYAKLIRKPVKELTEEEKYKVAKFRRQTMLLDHNSVTIKAGPAISLSHLVDASGENLISDVISQLINGWVDIAKDAWIFNIQGNKEVAPTLLFMIQAGVPFKTAVYFASMPLVREYVEEQRKAKSTFAGPLNKAPKQKNWYRSEARKVLLRKYYNYSVDDFISNDGVYRDTVRATGKYLKGRNFTEKELEDKIKSPSKEITELDKAAFLHYIEIENLAKPTTQVKMNVNVDTKKSSTLFEAQSRISMIKGLKWDGTFSGDLIDNVTNDSPISSFYIQPFQLELLGDLFPLRNHSEINDFLGDLDPFSPSVKTTFPDDLESLANNFRNDIVSYIFQNVLHPVINKQVKTYKGYSVNREIPLKKLDILTHGAVVDNGTLYVDFDTLEKQFTDQLYLKEEYSTKYGYAKVAPGAFKRVDDYYRFVFEREIVTYQNPYSKIKDTSEYETFTAVFDEKVPIRKNESDENYKKRKQKTLYQMFVRDKALDSVYNLDKLFKSSNTYADQFVQLTDRFPELLERYEVVAALGPSDVVAFNNLRVNDMEITGDKLNLWHEQLLTLSDPSQIDIGNEQDKLWIANFFKRFPIVAFLQSGLNTKGAFSLVRMAPVDKWIDIMEEPSEHFTKNLNKDVLRDFFSKFVDQNAIFRGGTKARGKDLHTQNFDADLFGGIGERRLVKGRIKLNLIEDWVQNGTAVTTVRGNAYHESFYKGDGIYKTAAGNFVDITHRGLIQLIEDKIVGDDVSYTKDEFGKAEGFGNWEGFVAGSKYAGKALQEGKLVHLYDILPVNEESELELIAEYSKDMGSYVENGLTHFSDGITQFDNDNFTVKKAEELLKANPKVYIVYNKPLNGAAAIAKNDFAFNRVSLANTVGLTSLDSYNSSSDLSSLKDINGAINPAVEEKINVEIGLMLKLKSKGFELAFNSAGYGTNMLLVDPKTKQPYAPQTFHYLSQQLYTNFGFVNPGFIGTIEGLRLVQEGQDVTDRQIAESQSTYATRELPEIEDINFNTCVNTK